VLYLKKEVLKTLAQLLISLGHLLQNFSLPLALVFVSVSLASVAKSKLPRELAKGRLPPSKATPFSVLRKFVMFVHIRGSEHARVFYLN